NILSFDIPAIQKVYPNFKPKGVVRDTLILSRMLYGDIKDRDFEFKRRNPNFPGHLIGRHSLEAWGHRLKLFKGDFKGPWDEWSPAMQDYCEQDVAVTHRLWTMFQKK